VINELVARSNGINLDHSVVWQHLCKVACQDINHKLRLTDLMGILEIEIFVLHPGDRELGSKDL
jgi:hypothetical protein